MTKSSSLTENKIHNQIIKLNKMLDEIAIELGSNHKSVENISLLDSIREKEFEDLVKDNKILRDQLNRSYDLLKEVHNYITVIVSKLNNFND